LVDSIPNRFQRLIHRQLSYLLLFARLEGKLIGRAAARIPGARKSQVGKRLLR